VIKNVKYYYSDVSIDAHRGEEERGTSCTPSKDFEKL
jgi:hypothetical protein